MTRVKAGEEERGYEAQGMRKRGKNWQDGVTVKDLESEIER